MSTRSNRPVQVPFKPGSSPLPSHTPPATADISPSTAAQHFPRQFRDLHSLSPERQALYLWGEEHSWPALPISAWETICGGSQEAWQVAVEELTTDQLHRAQTATQAFSAKTPLPPQPLQTGQTTQKTRVTWPFRRSKEAP